MFIASEELWYTHNTAMPFKIIQISILRSTTKDWGINPNNMQAKLKPDGRLTNTGDMTTLGPMHSKTIPQIKHILNESKVCRPTKLTTFTRSKYAA